MQFKNPEILFALFLLLIPLFIHLFQLRRFQKVAFTNVAFLKKVTIQTRKSSQIKKWLVLLFRTIALACIIFAFAQPFSASKNAVGAKTDRIIYVDNSFSMQIKGRKGPLLERALQDLYEIEGSEEKITWFTNSQVKKSSSIQDFKNDILEVSYTYKQLSPSQVLLKAGQLFSKDKSSNKQLIYISDFQTDSSLPKIPAEISVKTVELIPEKIANISIDTAFISSKNAGDTALEVIVSNLGKDNQQVPVSLFNKNKLIAKTSADFSDNEKSKLTFDIGNSSGFKGKIELTDQNLQYDNALYFNINSSQKIKVLAINEANSDFLQRLFQKKEFDFSQQSFKSMSYSAFSEQNFIILNELKDIPISLVNALISFNSDGGSILIIPSKDINLSNYNALLSKLNMGAFSTVSEQEKKVTKIIFSHPIYRDVFEKEVANFQFPMVKSSFKTASNAAPVLTFEDSSPFLLQKRNVYLFTAPINLENSNFQNSPLVVPTLYNISQLSLPLPELFYNIGSQNTIAIPVKLEADKILSLKDSTVSLIPLQQTKANQVLITTLDQPTNAGTFGIWNDETLLENVSFNYNRSESNLQYLSPKNWEGAENYKSISELFESVSEANSINSFWKWFAIFALLFLIIEMLILKFYK